MACIKEPRSIYGKEGERFAYLKELPPPLLWCPMASHSTGCKRLRPDCIKERREEMRELEILVDGCHLKFFLERWNAWKTEEGEEAREVKKRKEAEMRWIERLLEPD